MNKISHLSLSGRNPEIILNVGDILEVEKVYYPYEQEGPDETKKEKAICVGENTLSFESFPQELITLESYLDHLAECNEIRINLIRAKETNPV